MASPITYENNHHSNTSRTNNQRSVIEGGNDERDIALRNQQRLYHDQDPAIITNPALQGYQQADESPVKPSPFVKAISKAIALFIAALIWGRDPQK